nr:hypothetical protein [uncultured Carboxylicivirga sp.]
MKYLHEILWYLSLPVTIAVSYYAVLKGLQWLDKSLEKDSQDE